MTGNALLGVLVGCVGILSFTLLGQGMQAALAARVPSESANRPLESSQTSTHTPEIGLHSAASVISSTARTIADVDWVSKIVEAPRGHDTTFRVYRLSLGEFALQRGARTSFREWNNGGAMVAVAQRDVEAAVDSLTTLRGADAHPIRRVFAPLAAHEGAIPFGLFADALTVVTIDEVPVVSRKLKDIYEYQPMSSANFTYTRGNAGDILSGVLGKLSHDYPDLTVKDVALIREGSGRYPMHHGVIRMDFGDGIDRQYVHLSQSLKLRTGHPRTTDEVWSWNLALEEHQPDAILVKGAQGVLRGDKPFGASLLEYAKRRHAVLVEGYHADGGKREVTAAQAFDHSVRVHTPTIGYSDALHITQF